MARAFKVAVGPNIDIQIERWAIERLIPRANNPRTHSREQVARIAASIREFGFTNPILVGPDNDIIALARSFVGRREAGHERSPGYGGRVDQPGFTALVGSYPSDAARHDAGYHAALFGHLRRCSLRAHQGEDRLRVPYGSFGLVAASCSCCPDSRVCVSQADALK
jgi:hypothetical protein